MPKNYKQNKQFDGKGGECERPAFYKKYVDGYYSEFIDLIMNAVRIDGLDYRREYFVKKNLFEKGYVGYNGDAGEFLITIPSKGILQVGDLWRNGEFKTRDNKSLGVHPYSYGDTPEQAFNVWRIFLANPSITPLFEIAHDFAELLAECDVGIRQNVCAVRTPAFWVVDDETFALSINHAIQAQQDGAPTIAISSAMAGTLKSLTNETPYIADKLNQIKKEFRNEFLTRIGILTANTNKRERVQTAEVTATVGESVDLIYSVIDFWNKQNDSYGLPYTMKFNGVTEDYYAPTEDGEDKDESEDEKND